jgi:Peptidase C13 family
VRYILSNLVRNLVAGLRVAFFVPVTRFAFRIDLAQLVLLFLVSAAIDLGRDWLRTDSDRVFSLLGAGTEFFGAGLFLFIAAMLALLYRQRAMALSLAVITLAALPVLQVALELPSLPRTAGLPEWITTGNIVLVWIIAVFIRCVRLALAPETRGRVPRALFGALLLSLPIWFSTWLAPNDPWFLKPAAEPAQGGLNAGSEPVLAAQSFLLDHLLERLDDERPGVTDLYFVGFAPYGLQDVFRKDVEAAQKVMDERWGTAGRSIVLINNPQTLLTTPFATVTNLREALNEIGGAIDAENDVVMVYLASHGSHDHRLAASQPPLTLVELTPAGMRQMLDDAGINWRIVVVSSCFSGGYIDPLKDDRTLVITASQSDRISFGCGDRSEATFFGEAFFQQGLATADSFESAFDIAKKRVDEREKSEGYSPPSNPQMWVGDAMAAKLKSLRVRGQPGGVTARFFDPRRDRDNPARRRLTTKARYRENTRPFKTTFEIYGRK